MSLYDPSGARKYLTRSERDAFLAASEHADRQVRTLGMTLAYAGCRLSEALALTIDRVDLAAGVLIFESLKKRQRGIYRAVPVPPALLSALDLVHGIREHQARRGKGRGIRLWPWSRMTGWRAIHAVMQAAGLSGPHASPKGLRHSFGVSAVSAGNDFLQVDDAGLARQVERLQRVCRLARLAGAGVVRIDGGWEKPEVPRERWFERIVAGLSAIRPYLESEGFVLALDNHGTVTNDADFCVRIFEAVGSGQIGANMDTMNYRWAGHDLAAVGRFYHVIAPFVRHVHLKDGRGSRGQYRGTALGEGEIDLELAVRELSAAGYAGPWVVEYEGPRDEAEAGYRRGLQWLRAHVPA